MSFSAEDLRNDYDASGGATDFNFTFPVYDEDDFSVYKNGSLLVKGTHYTVRSGAGLFNDLTEANLPATGFIRLVTPATAGDDISIIPLQPVKQTSEYTIEPFPAGRIEKDFDKTVMVVRMLREILGRAIKFASQSLKKDQDVDDPIPGKFMRAKNPGPGFDWAQPTDSALSLPVPIADGGTGATTAAGARTALDVPQISATVLKSLFTTKGDLVVATGSATPVRLPVGANGKVLKANSAVSEGVEWGDLVPSGGWMALGLVGSNDGVSPNTKYGWASCNLLIMRSPSDGSISVFPNPTIPTNDTGLDNTNNNGRDQAGAFGSGTWIHFYAVDAAGVVRTRSSLTAPPTGPALQSGETRWAYLGAVRKNGSGNLEVTRTNGNRMTYAPRKQVLSNGVNGAEQTLDLSSFIPPNAVDFDTEVHCMTTGGSSAANAVETRVITGQTHDQVWNSATANMITKGNPRFPNIGQQIFWIVIGGGTLPEADIYVQSYTIPNGG